MKDPFKELKLGIFIIVGIISFLSIGPTVDEILNGENLSTVFFVLSIGILNFLWKKFQIKKIISEEKEDDLPLEG